LPHNVAVEDLQLPPPPELAEIDESIERMRFELRRLRRTWFLIVGSIGLWVLVLTTFVVLGITVNGSFFAGVGGTFFVGLFTLIQVADELNDPRPAMYETRRDLERARAERREQLAGRAKRSAIPYARYKEHLPYLVESYRRRAGRYQRGYVLLQACVIVGSFSASAIVAASRDEAGRIAAIVVSLTVSVAASFLLTFRLRERGDNLQSTANEIEREYRAAELRIGRYAEERDDRRRLLLLVERIEDLRFQQADVARQLEQPPDVSLPSGVDGPAGGQA
jgi:Protein of unknown function (DUF4231)